MCASSSVRITLNLPARDYRVYAAAATLLTRIMGRKAPNALTLIQHNLQGHDATGVVDGYLDSVDWPLAAGRVVSLRQAARRAARGTGAPRLPGALSPVNPSRN